MKKHDISKELLLKKPLGNIFHFSAASCSDFDNKILYLVEIKENQLEEMLVIKAEDQENKNISVALKEMNPESFWRILEQAKGQADGDLETAAEYLANMLSDYEVKDILLWCKIFEEYIRLSYRGKLKAAAYMLNGSCNDDEFRYFQAWLISLGKKGYLDTLKNPDSLARLGDIECAEWKEIQNAPIEAFFRKKDASFDVALFEEELKKCPMPAEWNSIIETEIIYDRDIDVEWKEKNEDLCELLPELALFLDMDWEESTLESKKFQNYLKAGKTFHEIGEYEKAIEEYLEFIKLEPDKFEGYFGAAINYQYIEKYQEAMEYHNRAISLYDPIMHSQTREYYWRGECRYFLGDSQNALEDFKKSCDYEPYKSDSYCFMGVIYNTTKDYKNALIMHEKALELSYANHENGFSVYDLDDAWYGKGMANQGMNRFKEALWCYGSCITLNHERWHAYKLAGYCANFLGFDALGKQLLQIFDQKYCDNAENVVKMIVAAIEETNK